MAVDTAPTTTASTDLVPIRLGLTEGNLYTVWAPRWQEGPDEYEGFLGEGDDLYGFTSAADLTAFVRGGSENDLSDHPGWEKLTEANAHRLNPGEDREFDLIAVSELVAEKPSEDGVASLARTLAVVSSLGTVCELPDVTKFFNGNPTLASINGGFEEFRGKAGQKRWNNIATIVGRGWEKVIAAIDEIVTTPDVDSKLSAKAEEELAEDAPEPEVDEIAEAATAESDDSESADDDAPRRAAGDDVVLGGDKDFWKKVGIDPIRVITGAGTFYTLRCYLGERPIFLGRNGRVSVFGSERALARYLADEHDHDLSDLSTYADIRTAATDGSLRLDITEDNIYVLTGLADDISDGPDAVDHEQFELAIEFLNDLGDYSEEETVNKALAADKPLGKFVSYVLDESGTKPSAPYAAAVSAFEDLERFTESRLRRE